MALAIRAGAVRPARGHRVGVVGQAEAETGVSRSALRSWYRNGEIPSRLVDGPNGPQRLVPFDLVVEPPPAPSHSTQGRTRAEPRSTGRASCAIASINSNYGSPLPSADR
jgi:hypothetical protein